jgi:hypothetical protein
LQNVSIRYEESRNRAACCSYKYNILIFSKIHLANPFITKDQIDEIVHHEIAHILTREGHNETFKRILREIYPKWSGKIVIEVNLHPKLYWYIARCKLGCCKYYNSIDILRCHEHNSWLSYDKNTEAEFAS